MAARRTSEGRRFRSLKEIQSVVKSEVDQIVESQLKSMAKEIKREMKKLINEFYSNGESEYYDRTGQLKDAVNSAESMVYKTTRGYRIVIKLFDTTQMHAEEAIQRGNFNSYMDFDSNSGYGGTLYTDWVIEWLDTGNNSGLTPISYSEVIDGIIQKYMDKGLVQEMNRAGYMLR